MESGALASLQNKILSTLVFAISLFVSVYFLDDDSNTSLIPERFLTH